MAFSPVMKINVLLPQECGSTAKKKKKEHSLFLPTPKTGPCLPDTMGGQEPNCDKHQYIKPDGLITLINPSYYIL
jgi:hypothetical protein